jgi:hypothetical protein
VAISLHDIATICVGPMGFRGAARHIGQLSWLMSTQ